MRIKLLTGVVFLLFFGVIFSQSISDIPVTGSYSAVSIKDFMLDIEERYDVRFYYNNEAIPEGKVSLDIKDKPLLEVLESALFSTPYTYFFLSDNVIIILSKRNPIRSLQAYSSLNSDYEQEEQHEIEEFLSARRTDTEETIVVGIHQSYADKVVVKGFLRDESTSDPLVGATLYFLETKLGFVSDIVGSVKFEMPPGKYNVEFRSIGMKTQKCFLDIHSEGSFSFAMKESSQMLDEVVINAKKSYGNRTENMGEDKLVMKKVQNLPSLTGDVDIVSIAKMLPGVVSVSEGSGGVNVRGGGADQNMFYFNNIPLYNTSHAFGFFPAINSAIIDDFSVYKSYIPIEYGGRLSSVFDVKAKSGNKNNFFVQGSLGLITADIAAEGPIIKDKLSYVVSARASYSDWILKQIPDEDLKNSNMSFRDFSALVNWQIDDQNELEVTCYNSYDYFNSSAVNSYDYSNFGLGANYFHKFSQTLNSEFSVSYSDYGFSNTDLLYDISAYTQNYGIDHAEVRGKFDYLYKENHVFEMGFSSTFMSLDRGSVLPYGEASLYEPIERGKETGIENVLFFQDSYKVNTRLNLKGGLRYSFFTQYGPAKVYEYEPNRELSEGNIIDTSFFSKNAAVTNYSGPELRLAADYSLNGNSSLKLSYTQMRQYMFLLSNTYAITPIDQWKMSDSHLAPSKQWQVSTGYYQDLPSWKSSFVAEIYYKKADNITELKGGADLITALNLERVTLQGDQESYGMEFMLSKNSGILTGWASYTYSRSFMQIDGDAYWDRINGGRKYASNFDKPHVLNMIANLQLSRRVSLATNLVYSTGRPITMLKSSYFIDDVKYLEYSDRNAYRVPDYFRLDLSLSIDGNLKANKNAHSKWVISVYNLTGRSNPYSVYFKNENNNIKGYQYSLIGVPIVSLSWSFKLGNYLNE